MVEDSRLFEKHIYQGKTTVHYVQSFSFEESISAFKLFLLPNIDSKNLINVTFTHVSNYVENMDSDSYDKDCIQSIIGIDNYFLKNNKYKVVIRTDDFEITFKTDKLPEIDS